MALESWLRRKDLPLDTQMSDPQRMAFVRAMKDAYATENLQKTLIAPVACSPVACSPIARSLVACSPLSGVLPLNSKTFRVPSPNSRNLLC